ncbi:MAG: oligosaccharide flippase family protein [Gemmatimonadota bacterium]
MAGSPGAEGDAAVPLVDGARLTRNVFVTVGVQVVSWALTFVVTLFVPRYLGPDLYGRLMTATAFVTVCFVLAPWGMGPVLTKEIARTPARMGTLVMNALALRVALALVCGVVTLVAGYVLGYRGMMLGLLAIGAMGMLVAGVNEVFGAALAGEERFRRQGFVALVDKAISSGASLLLVIARAPLALFAVPAVAASVAQATMHVVRLRAAQAHLFSTLRPSREVMRFLLVAGLPYLGQTAFLTLYGQTDVLVLSMVADYRTVGWYNVAWKLVGTTMFLPVAVSTALLPTFTRLHHAGDEEAFAQLGRRALEIVLVVGVPIAVVMLLIPGVIIDQLYTREFAGAIPVLRLGGICCLLYYITIILSTMVNAREQQKRLVATSIVVCTAGIPSCLFFSWLGHTRFGNGAAGAVLSDALIELVLLVALLRIVPAGFLSRETMWQAGRFTLAAVPMAGALYWMLSAGSAGVWIVVPALGMYLLGLWALGGMDRSHVDLLRRALRR